MISVIGPIFIILLILVIIRLFRRKKGQPTLGLRDTTTIIDRSIAAYRRHLVPALLLSALCFLLGSGSGYNLTLIGTLIPWLFTREAQPTLPTLITNVVALLNVFGIGSALLAVGVATGMHAASQGAPVAFVDFLPRQRPRALLGLVLLMVLASLVSAILGIIGMLIALFWSLAPVIMRFEGLNPWQAVRRSYTLVRANYSALLNTLVPLWLIGWLIVGLPIFGTIWLLTALGLVGTDQSALLATIGLMLGQIAVTPLTAFGVVCLYQYIQAPADAAASLEAAMVAQGLSQAE